MELPFKRQRKSDHGLETLESFINGKSYGLLLSRLPEDFKLLDEHLNISFFPKVNERNGGLCILFAENNEKLEEFKNWSNKYVKIQRTEFIITGRKKQIDFMVIFKQIKKTLKKCFFEFEDREMQKNHKQITSRTASSQNEEMCDRIKKLSEDLIINYFEELILGFKSFENEESIDCDWKFNEFSRKIFFATLCFIQVKLQRIQLKQVLYFFNRFQGYELLKRFKRFRTIEKVYIVEILFQLAFEKQPFRKENEEEIYISTTSINFEINYMTIKRENSEKLEKILLSFNQKYFPSIESTKFAAMVRHYISSIKIVGLPNALSGITLMNSVVLISNRNFLKIKEFENNESSKRSTEEGLKACEDSEDSDDFQPALQEASEEKYAGPIGFFF